MHLSIFNSNQIIKIISIFLLLFVGYNIFLVFTKPNIVMLQNQREKNYSFAQEFIYGEKKSNIIVGSSMAARIKSTFLPKEFYNLSFSGGSVLTGLEIIKKTGYIPKVIYIENNEIFRRKDDQMLKDLFYPILWKGKYYIPALQTKYHLLNIVISSIKGNYGKTHEEYMKKKRDNHIFNMSLKRHILNYDKKPKDYNNKLQDLKRLVNYFESHGTKIIFFEMPIDERLANSTKAKFQREVIKQNFTNAWLSLPENSQYTTADGIHLIYPSAYRYSKKFLELVKD